MGTKQFNNYEDLITYTRASKGYALRPVSYGTELVTNGDGSSTDGWTTANTTLSIVSEALRVTATGSSATASQGVSTVVGKVYKFSASLNGGTAVDQIRVGTAINTATGGGSLTSTGEFVFVATTSTTYITLKAGDVSGLYADFDNISVKEVLFDQPDGTLTLFEHPDDVPRVEYDADGNRLGLLVEEQRTNLFTYSQDFSTWTSFNSDNFTVNYAQAPDGTQTATRFNPEFATDPGVSAKVIRVYRNINSTAGDVVTFSLFVKPVQSSSLYVNNPDGSDVDRDLLVTFNADQSSGTSFWNLKTKTWELIDSDHTAFQEAYPDGWYRIGITYTVANNDIDNNHFISFANRTAQASFDPYPSGEEDAYIWGAQVEEGSFPTSYMKNEGTASGEDRSADVASIPVADFGWNTDIGSVVAEYNPLNVSDSITPVFELSSDSTNNRLYSLASTSRHWFVRSNAVTTADIDLGTPIESQQNKIAGAYKKDDFAASLNGGAVGTDTAGSMSVGIEDILIGSLHNNYYLNGHIKSIQYYPRRLTNAQLQDLTS